MLIAKWLGMPQHLKPPFCLHNVMFFTPNHFGLGIFYEALRGKAS